jgi:hypothetical protein
MGGRVAGTIPGDCTITGQDIEARQSLPARIVRAGGLSIADEMIK